MEIMAAALRSTPQYCPSALARTMSSPVPVAFVLAWTKDATMSMTVMINQVYLNIINVQIDFYDVLLISDEINCERVSFEPGYQGSIVPPPPPVEGQNKAIVNISLSLAKVMDIK